MEEIDIDYTLDGFIEKFNINKMIKSDEYKSTFIVFRFEFAKHESKENTYKLSYHVKGVSKDMFYEINVKMLDNKVSTTILPLENHFTSMVWNEFFKIKN